MKKETKQEKRFRRHRRVRAKIFGTAQRPRLCVFRSAKHIYAQLIDDEKGVTLAAASDQELKPKIKNKKPKTPTVQTEQTKNAKMKKEEKSIMAKVDMAYKVGKLIAEKALKKKIKKVVFDRGGYAYHGRIKTLADGARAGGLKF